MRKLIIDEYGAKVHGNSYSYPFDQTLDVAISRLLHPERLEIWPLRLPPQPPPGETNRGTFGPGYYMDRLPTLEETANDILRRENAELRGTIARMRDVHDRLTEANTRQLRQSEGLKNDVRQAESHYETASKRAETMRRQMAAVTSVLNGTNIILDYDSHTPTLELAREVVAGSHRRWKLYEETMARLVQLGKDVELLKRAHPTLDLQAAANDKP